MNPITTLLLLVILASCSTTKQVQTSKSTVDSMVTRVRDSASQVITALNTEHTRMLKEAHDNTITFTPDCDTVIIDDRCNVDSILKLWDARPKPVNKVVYSDKGRVASVEGRIATINAHTEVLEMESDRLKQTIDELYHTRDSLSVELVKAESSKVREVKRGVTWWWLILCYAAGIATMFAIHKNKTA